MALSGPTRPLAPLLLLGALLLGTILLDTGGCADLAEQRPTAPPATATRPAWRVGGPRLPSFSGADPVGRGWVKVDGVLWIDGKDEAAYRRGFISTGSGYVPFAEALPSGTPARGGFLLRTDHVALRTNLTWARAVGLARMAEEHVTRLVGTYGDALDLRLPADPLPVVVAAGRREFEDALASVVSDPVSWQAFYDARDGAVWVSAEPPSRGGLPLAADLRHEMTHQVLDLSTEEAGRSRMFEGLHFWLWEGFAVYTETLGDPPGTDVSAARLDRFLVRLRLREWTPLDRLFRLSQAEFEGRHYDQTSSLMRHLMEREGPTGRAAVLETLRLSLHGASKEGDLERLLGGKAVDVEARWLAAVGR